MSWDPQDQKVFVNEEDEMARLTDPASTDVGGKFAKPAQPVQRSLDGKFVCPFCGTVNARTDEPCPSCGMENTPATRNSTRGRVGPWYVLQKRNPAAPGMKYETLIKFVRKGRIQPKAILRGPTTSQLWRFASSVKGVSREFGLCYNCGGDIETTANRCPHCSRDQRPPADPNALLEAATVAKSAAARPQPAPVADDVDLREDTVFGEPSPESSAPAMKPAAVSPAAAFSAAPISNPAPSAFPLSSREDIERQEIAAGRLAREQAPRDPNKNAPTLSARELATAFQLDFTPVDRKHRRRKTSKTLVAFLLLLALGGAGTAAYLKVPQFHDQLNTWYAQASAKIQELTAGNQSTNKPAPPSLNNLTLQSLPSNTSVAPTVKNPSPAIPTPGNTATTPKPETVVEAPKQVVVTPLAPKLTLDEAYDVSRKLWRQANDAEAQGDWKTAVALYERIKTLPEKARQSGLDLRLNAAKAKLTQ